MLKILLVLNSLVWSSTLAAAMDMQKTIAEKTTEFRYQWPPEPELSFLLDNKQIKENSGSNRRYSTELADQQIRHQVLVAAVKLQQRGVRVQMSPKNLPFQVIVRGTDPIQVEKVQQQLQREKAQLAIQLEKARVEVEIAKFQAEANLQKARGLTPEVLQEMAIKGWIEKGCPMPAAVGSSGFYQLVDPKK